MTRHMPMSLSAALCGLLLAMGCADLAHNKRADEARDRWSHMRARVKLQLAQKSFDGGAIEDALKQCNEVLRLDPDVVEGYLLAARIRLERGEMSKAQNLLDVVRDLGATTGEEHYLRGLVAERQGRSDEALEQFRIAYETDRDELDYLLTYVESLIAADRHQEALETVTPRRMDFEQTPAVHALAGQALGFMGRLTEAAECYQLAVHLAPDNPVLREEAADAFLAVGWDHEVIDTLTPLVMPQTTRPADERAVARTSCSPETFRALATALIRRGKTARAIGVLRQGVEDYSEAPTLWLMLAEACLRANELGQAGAAVKRAVLLAPEQPAAQLLLAYYELQTDQIQEAIGTAQRLVESNPEDVEARALLACALERHPDSRAKAAEQYRRILAIVPRHPWAELRLQRLTQQAKAR